MGVPNAGESQALPQSCCGPSACCGPVSIPWSVVNSINGLWGVVTLAAGPGITIDLTTGTLTFSATGTAGVTTLAGTANQVAVSAATGAVTISLPSNVTISGIFTSNIGQFTEVQSDTVSATFFDGDGAGVNHLNADNISSGTLAVARGGTGQTTYTNGQLLIGNTTGNTLTKATLTGTENQVVVTNGAGTITLSLPQSIGTSSSLSFSALTLTTLTLDGVFNDSQPSGGVAEQVLSSTGLGTEWAYRRRTIAEKHTTTGNVGAGEDDLWNVSIPGGTFVNSGDRLISEFHTTQVIPGSDTNFLRVYWNGVLLSEVSNDGSVPDTETLWRVVIVSTGAATQNIFVYSWSKESTIPILVFGTTGAATTSGSVTFKVTGEAQDAASGELNIYEGIMEYVPAP